MSNRTTPEFRFEVEALDRGAFEVVQFGGTEVISGLYRFEVELVSHDPAIELDDVIASPACLTMASAPGDRRIHGIVSNVEQGGQCGPGRYAYRATLVPRLWALSQSRRSRIYQSKSVPEIVAERLRDLTAPGPARAHLAADVVFRLQHDYPIREYLVQYAESDLDFISRLLEHEGISYFFEQGEDRERLVITDHNAGFCAVAHGVEVPYSPSAGDGPAGSVGSLVCERRSLPRRLILHDYDYRRPHVPLQAESDVDADGVGLVAEFGARFDVPEEGQRLSRVRGEELRCRRRMFTGDADTSAFGAGHRYRLAAHFRDDFNQDYLLCRVDHSAAPSEGDPAVLVYRNRFESVPADVTYRPERTTARPRLHGSMSAHVDGDGAPGERARMDDEGRYKLVMPFDLDGARAGEGSCFVRMAQPFGGKDQGMHFPLSKGTEVVWTCIDGDPDRPVITSSVPNPVHRSVVTSENADRNVLRTSGGITMEFADGDGSTRDGGGGPAPAPGRPSGTPGAPQRCADGLSRLVPQRHLQDPDGLESAEEKRTGAKWFKLYVPDHNPMTADASALADQGDNAASTYFRLGSYDAGDSIESEWFTNSAGRLALNINQAGQTAVTALTGVFDYTEWNRTTVTMHNNEQYVHGKNRITIGGGGLGLWDAGYAVKNYFRQVGEAGGTKFYRHTTMDHSSSDSYQFGDSESFFGGFTFSGTAGLSTGINLGGSLNLGASMDVDVGYGFSVNAKLGANVDLVSESQNTMDAKNHDILCDNSVQIRTKGPAEAAADMAGQETVNRTWKTVAAVGGAALGGVAAVGSLGVLAPYLGGLDGDSEDSAATWATTVGIPLATAAWAAGLIYGAVKNRAVDTNARMAPSSIDLTQGSIKMAVGLPPGGISVPTTSSSIEIGPMGIKLMVGGPTGSSIELKPAGVTIKCGATTSLELSPASLLGKGTLCRMEGTSAAVVKGANLMLQGRGTMAV